MRSDRGMEGSVKASGVDDGGGTGGEVGVRVLNGIVGRGIVERNDIVGRGNVGRERREMGVAVGMALCVSASPVLTVDMAVSMTSASLIVGVDWPLPQDASMIAARNKGINNVLLKMFILPFPLMFYKETLNAAQRGRVGRFYLSKNSPHSNE